MITIDGSHGEGGGQILRTSLALSLVTGRPFRMERIRARRERPGLLRQHLTAVEAARAIGCAEVEGAALNSQTLEFEPGPLTPGNYHFAVGTAGSATLVLQTVLPPLLIASGPSILTLEGGTHNPMAPPFDFLAKCFVPLLHRMGTPVELELVRPGFYPAGGGQFHARIKPGVRMAKLDLLERGPIRQRQARVLISRLPEHVAERELAVLRSELKWQNDEYTVETISHSVGPGNAILMAMEADHVTEIVAAIGERGRRAEEVAMSAIKAARAWLDAGVPVDEHLADQLLIPMALAGGGAFRTTRPSLHTTTNAEVIQHFLPIPIRIEQESEIVWRIDVGKS